MKIKTEDLYALISESISNGIYSVLNEARSNDDMIDKKKEAIMGHIRKRIDGVIPSKDDDSYIDDITTIGINPKFDVKDRKNVKKQYLNQNFETNLRDRLVSSASILHNYSNLMTHTFNFDRMQSDCNNSANGTINGLGKNNYSMATQWVYYDYGGQPFLLSVVENDMNFNKKILTPVEYTYYGEIEGLKIHYGYLNNSIYVKIESKLCWIWLTNKFIFS